MSINLLDLVKDQVSGVLAKQASSFLGESESSVSSALGSIMPTLLGSVLDKSSNPSGAQGIMDMVGKLDLGALSNIAGLFGGGASSVNGLLNSGGGIVESLLGNKMGGAIDIISKLSGMKSGSTSSLLKMAAPLLMGVIGNQVKGKGLSGLTDLLMGQKSHVANALPAGISSLMGFANMGGSTNSTHTTSSTTSSRPAVTTGSTGGGGNSWMKWLLPILLGAAAIYFFTTKGCGKKAIETSQEMASDVTDAAAKAGDMVMTGADSLASKVGGLFTKTLSSGFALVNATETGVESQLVNFVENSSAAVDKTIWFNFDRLLFDTGKATLQSSSKEQLVNVGEIMKAFPKVHIKLGGYTDNVGDPKSNQRLSTDRAFNVKNALVELGIDKSRIEAEGYGDQHPVASNDTEEGRQQNRRIAVNVTQK
jgi:OmpA-OmpF porin, OOP family